MKRKPEHYRCAVEATMDLIGGKYKSLILWYLNDNKILRFNELSRYIPDATPKMLTRQLRMLEQDGLIERKVYPEVPPKVEYKLTSFGKSLYPILNAMDNWGLKYLDDNGIIIGEN